MNTQTAAAIETTPAPFTVCALVQTQTTVYRCHAPSESDPSLMVFTGEKSETREIGRIEFIPMGEWVLVGCLRSPITGTQSAWEPYSREDARALYKSVAAGTHTRHCGTWTAAEPTTKIVGSKAMPARREMYSYGDVAYMYVMVDFPAMLCPVIEMGRGDRREKCALQPFAYTTPPTPGDRYSHNRTAIQWTEVRDAS